MKAWASGVGCECKPFNIMNDTNSFQIVTDYEGRYYAICQHCGKEIKLFKEIEPYFQKVKEGEIVVDDRYGESKIDRYDHFMSTIVVYFDNKHTMYNFDGTDYKKNNDGIQHLKYKYSRRINDL